MQNALNGIRVLDLSRLLPGPYCTMLLADMGAEVIKVETPTVGDYARLAPPEMGISGMFEAVNRGKKSVGLNYRNRRGREVFLKLAETADVILESFRPGVVGRRGIDYAAVRQVNPQVIYCSLSGYGQSGPYSQQAGHDLNYIAVGGLLGLNGAAGGPPIPPGVPIADLGGGMLAAVGILGALVGRERHGRGAYLDVAMLDAVVSWVAPLAGGQYFSSREVPERGRMILAGGLPCFNVYQASDGEYFTLAALEPHFWGAFCEVVERPDLIGRRFDPAIQPEVAELFRQRSGAEWLASFEGVDACVEPVAAFDEMLAHPQVRHRGLTLVEERPEGEGEGGQVTGIHAPLRLTPREGLAPAPELGQHTWEILVEAGIDAVELRTLSEKGVVKQA